MLKKYIFLLYFFFLAYFSVQAQIQPVTGISTNFNGYWATTTASNNPIEPNNSHELLSFTYNGIRYSTGVNDAILTANNATFTAGNYRALPIAGLTGSLANNTTATLLAMASLKDGNPTQGISTHPNISGKTIRNVLIDGVRGLDLGTGVTNLPSSAVMSFGIFSIREDAILDAFPDLLVTQIAQPGTSNTDTYAFYDASGNLVGNTVTQTQASLAQLGLYRLDLFSLTAGPLTNATPWGGLFETANGTRPIRLSAYRLSDFGITTGPSGNYTSITEFRIVPSGASDLAFIGYNASAINFRPAISTDPGNSVSTVCSGGTAILKIIATPANDGVLTYQWQEKVGSNPFTDIANGGSYSGATTEELRVTNPTNGVQYRCIVTETSPFLVGIASTSGTFIIAISAIGNPTISTQPADFTNCAGTPYNIFVIPSGGTGVYNYQWQSGTSATGPWTNINGATESNLSGVVASPGPAWFRVVVSNDGCNGSITSNVSTITTTGAGTVLTTGNVERCGPGPVTLTASSSNGGTFSWRNNLGVEVGTLSSFTTPSLTVSTDFFVTATISGCTTPANTVTAIIKQNYRTSSSGLWDNLDGNPATTIWEVQASNGSWLATPVIPAQGTPVNILHEVIQNVDFTVENCPLTLLANGASKLIINPDISLKFAGGTEGNAYFNNRPVVIRSTIDGTGAIGEVVTNSAITGAENVQLERFLPNTNRRWNLLTPGVVNGTTINTTTTLLDAWADGRQRPVQDLNRVTRSNNRRDGLIPEIPLGNPYNLKTTPQSKPKNMPWPLYVPSINDTAALIHNPATSGYDAARYTPYTGTIITGHRHTSGTLASAQGFDWWDELIIPAGSIFYVSPTEPVLSTGLRTTPSSIRPYRPTGSSDFGPERGTSWISNADSVNSIARYGGRSIVQLTLNEIDHGYMLFTRGDRRVLENWYDSTTLRPVGKIRTGNVIVNVSASPVLTVMPNPYPAPISLEKLFADPANTTALGSTVHIWNSNIDGSNKLGGWVTLTRLGNNDWIPAPEVASGHLTISSSQAFMTEGSSTGGAVTYKESLKTNLSEVNFLPFENEGSGSSDKTEVLVTNLNNRNSSTDALSIIDGAGILLNSKFTAATTDGSDVKKVFNFEGGKSLSLLRGSASLSFDAHPQPVGETVFPLQATQLAKSKYAFTFHPKDLEKDGREVWLKDKFLGTETPISLTAVSQYNFEGTSDAASISPTRFEIVFRQGEVLPVIFTSINAVEQGKNINVSWNVATEDKMSHYEVEHSTNGTEFGKAVKVDAKNTSPAAYNWLHVQPGSGDHFYRVRAFNFEGRSLLTKVVKVTFGDNAPGFKAFPTVVSKSTDVTLQLISLDKGNYTLQVTDMAGRIIQSQNIQHNGGSASMIMSIKSSLGDGKYNIRLSNQEVNFVESILRVR